MSRLRLNVLDSHSVSDFFKASHNVSCNSRFLKMFLVVVYIVFLLRMCVI